jgi:hypothetical protein
VVVKFADVVDSDVAFELFAWLSAFFVEVRSEPDLLEMGLMRIAGQDLLYGDFLFACAVDAQPDHAETASSQQSHTFELVRETVAKFLILLGS